MIGSIAGASTTPQDRLSALRAGHGDTRENRIHMKELITNYATSQPHI